MYGDATADYLIYQGKKGADMVQVFDTWLSEMPREKGIDLHSVR